MIKALYTFGELSALLGISSHRVRRIVQGAGIACVVSSDGRRMLVPLAEFRAKCPLVWESVTAKDSADSDS